MKKFVFTSEKTDCEVYFTFSDGGFLMEFHVDGTITDAHLQWVHDHIPYHLCLLEKLNDEKNGRKVTELVNILEFDHFWNTYNYKVGNKNRAAKLWKVLTDSEKQNIFLYIPKYNRYLSFRGSMEKCYPETFLAQRRWESQLPTVR